MCSACGRCHHGTSPASSLSHACGSWLARCSASCAADRHFPSAGLLDGGRGLSRLHPQYLPRPLQGAVQPACQPACLWLHALPRRPVAPQAPRCCILHCTVPNSDPVSVNRPSLQELLTKAPQVESSLEASQIQNKLSVEESQVNGGTRVSCCTPFLDALHVGLLRGQPDPGQAVGGGEPGGNRNAGHGFV